jgi:hypothetical protein
MCTHRMPTHPLPFLLSLREARQVEIIWTPPSHWDRRAIQPNHIKFRICSALEPMWTLPKNESAELTQGALQLVHYFKCVYLPNSPTPGAVWLVTFRLGMGKSLTIFYSVPTGLQSGGPGTTAHASASTSAASRLGTCTHLQPRFCTSYFHKTHAIKLTLWIRPGM